jgi:GntR family transcriptional regulator
MSSHVKGATEAIAALIATRFDRVGADVAAHVRLTMALRETIACGDLLPGDAIPGDAALMRATGLARGTVRQAVATLRAEGLVQTRQGARTSVLQRPRLQPFSELVSFTAWAREQGAVPSARMVELVRRTAEPAVATQLRLAADELVWTMVRVRLLDGVPVMVEHATYPEHIGALLVDADLEAGSVYATLAECGVEVANGHHRISAIAAATTDAERLRVRTGTPLLRQERTVFASDGLPIEHSDDRWRSDAIVLDAVNSVQGSQLARRVATE